MPATASKPRGDTSCVRLTKLPAALLTRPSSGPKSLPDAADHRVHVVGVADVHRVRLDPAAVLRHQLGRGGVEHRLAAAADVELGAQLQVPGGDLAAQARAAAGDQDALALQQLAFEHEVLPV